MIFSNIGYDDSTLESIRSFQMEMEKHLPEMFTECAYRIVKDDLYVYYGNLICDALESSFKYVVDFKDFYANWLGLSRDTLPPSNYALWSDYIIQYREQCLGREIVDLFIKVMGEI